LVQSRLWRFGSILPIVGAIGTPSAALAQDTPGTTVQMSPYIWVPGIGGDFRLGFGGPAFRVDKSVGDVLEASDAAFFITGLVKTRRLIFMADLTHSSSSPDGLVPTGNPALPVVPAEGSVDHKAGDVRASVPLAGPLLGAALAF